ncbi:hypothetical protein [Zobellia sp. 1_MG-2023]|uniref:hypothetical protein n=1 Tax=Zobellia sp. 1_MG-2023 TaxID=3062626 RepID=UPI0026E39D41|nr:hypothetical protein [Zobellia sp. 1_MG-2023]MDO6819080.1 hypothetical protein [Zobellia sp. 1_MG-2023]
MKNTEITEEQFEKIAYYFDSSKFSLAEQAAKKRLAAWEDVQEEASKLIALPKTKQQFELLLENPLQYVKQKLDDIHRPDFNKLPISQDKLLELLEINLRPLHNAIATLDRHKGKLSFTVGSGVNYVLRKEDYTTYTKNENQNKEIKRIQKAIDALKAMYDSEEEFKSHTNLYKLQEFSRKVGTENGKLVPNRYYLYEVK